MAVRIEKHYARNDPQSRFHFITIYWKGGFCVLPERQFANPTEFQIAVELLRREDEVYWDEKTGELFTRHGERRESSGPWTGSPVFVRCRTRERAVEADEQQAEQLTG